jgi:hypothetical protein
MGKLRKGRTGGGAFIGVFTFVVVVFVVAALFMILWSLLTWIAGDEDPAPFIVCIITAALAIVYQITNTRITERKLPIEQERRVASASVYGNLLRACFATLEDKPGAARINEQALFAACQGAMPDILVYGSQEVVDFFGDIINLGSQMDEEGLIGDQRGRRVLDSLGQLLAAMRDDVGHDIGRLGTGQLQRAFMPDYDTALS